VGEHGIILELARAGASYRATYLPEVAADCQWTHEQAITSLLRKAGCPHLPRADWSAIQLTRYVSTKATLTYAEWAAR
jgi:AMMECR1 domain-containing protein